MFTALSWIVVFTALAGVVWLFWTLTRGEQEIGQRNPEWLAERQTRRARTNAALGAYFAYKAYDHHRQHQLEEAVEHGVKHALEHQHEHHEHW